MCGTFAESVVTDGQLLEEEKVDQSRDFPAYSVVTLSVQASVLEQVEESIDRRASFGKLIPVCLDDVVLHSAGQYGRLLQREQDGYKLGFEVETMYIGSQREGG